MLSHQLPQFSAYVINCAAAILCPHHIAIVADVTVKGGVKGKACSEWIWKNKGGNAGIRTIKRRDDLPVNSYFLGGINASKRWNIFFLNIFICIKTKKILYTLIAKYKTNLAFLKPQEG